MKVEIGKIYSHPHVSVIYSHPPDYYRNLNLRPYIGTTAEDELFILLDTNISERNFICKVLTANGVVGWITIGDPNKIQKHESSVDISSVFPHEKNVYIDL